MSDTNRPAPYTVHYRTPDTSRTGGYLDTTLSAGAWWWFMPDGSPVGPFEDRAAAVLASVRARPDDPSAVLEPDAVLDMDVSELADLVSEGPIVYRLTEGEIGYLVWARARYAIADAIPVPDDDAPDTLVVIDPEDVRCALFGDNVDRAVCLDEDTALARIVWCIGPAEPDTPRCPVCGGDLYATVDHNPWTPALVTWDGARWEYVGETEVCWDAQQGVTSPDGDTVFVCEHNPDHTIAVPFDGDGIPGEPYAVHVAIEVVVTRA